MDLSKEAELLTGCGEYCGLCFNYTGEAEPRCAGCNITKGHPFWGECKLYSCIKSREIYHCGRCEDFPCQKLVNHFNPNNPHGQRNAVVRVGILTFRAKYGDDKAIELLKKMGKPPRA